MSSPSPSSPSSPSTDSTGSKTESSNSFWDTISGKIQGHEYKVAIGVGLGIVAIGSVAAIAMFRGNSNYGTVNTNTISQVAGQTNGDVEQKVGTFFF